MKVTIVDGGAVVEVPSRSRPGLVHRVKPREPYCPCEKWEHTSECHHFDIANIALKKAGYLVR